MKLLKWSKPQVKVRLSFLVHSYKKNRKQFRHRITRSKKAKDKELSM